MDVDNYNTIEILIITDIVSLYVDNLCWNQNITRYFDIATRRRPRQLWFKSLRHLHIRECRIVYNKFYTSLQNTFS